MQEKENAYQQSKNYIVQLPQSIQKTNRHFGKIIKNSNKIVSSQKKDGVDCEQNKVVLRKGGIRKNQNKERALLYQENNRIQRTVSSNEQMMPIAVRSAEQVISEYISLKRTENKKDPNVAVIRRRGKGKEQFIKRIHKQVSLDIELRNMKHQICQKDKPALQKILNQKYGMKAEQWYLSSEQYDPFFKGKTIDNLEVFACQFYILFTKIHTYWKEEILNKFEEQMLTTIFDELCGKTKSEPVSLKTFAKELDIVFGKETCLKTRDLYSVYTRLRPFDRHNFVQTLKCNRQSILKKND